MPQDGIMGYRGGERGVSLGESHPWCWVRRGAESVKKKYRITVLLNKEVGVFFIKIIVH